MIALGTATEASVAGWGPIGLVASGLSEGRAALALSQYFAVFLLFRLLGVPLAARFPARHLVVVALTLSAIGAGLTLLLDQPEHAFALTGAIGLAFPNAFVWATGGTTGTARPAAVVVGTALVGAVLGPLAVGRLSGLAGGDALAALALLSVCAAAASVLVFGLTKREERGATATVASGAADRR